LGVYLGVGTTHGRRAFIVYSPPTSRVYATVDARFDETYFPFRTTNQRVYGQDYIPSIQLEQLSLYHDMPNPTVASIVERLQSTAVPGNTAWNLHDLLQLPATIEEQQPLDLDAMRNGDAEYSISGELSSVTTGPAGNSDGALEGFLPNNKAQNTVFVNGPPAPYGTLAPTWRAAGSKTVKQVDNSTLAEYLIGSEAKIVLPESYWPKDKVSWTSQCMDHRENKRAKGNHTFKCVLLESKPRYVGATGAASTYEAELSAWHIRNALELQHGGHKTLDEMFGDKTKGLLGLATDRLCSAMRSTAASMPGSKIRRHESSDTMGAAMIGMIWTALACDEHGQQFAGTRAIPRSYYDIKGRPDEQLWMEACDKEINKLFEMGTFSIIDDNDIPPGHKSINCCMSFKIKKDSDGNILEYRARCNADGRQQDVGSYGDTFAPTSKFSCIRSICAIAAQEGLTLYQFDVKGAFLLAECKERVYINLPGKYRLPKGKTLQCRRLIYGLKQAAHGWNQMFVKWLLDYGFINVDNDGVTFVKNVKKDDGSVSKILLSIHVDDGLAASSDETMYKDFIAAMSKDFDLSDSGELKWFLGGKVEQDREKGIVRLSQEQYCNDVLKRFQMSDCTPVDTPCEANLHLAASDSPPLDKRNADVVRNYQQLIGACMYLTCFTRGDCSFAVNQCARFMSNPGPTHIAAAKRILRYLVGTRSLGITYRRGAMNSSLLSVGVETAPNQLSASADADHAGADDRRSVSGWAIMLAGAMIAWSSKRQPVTAISSTESEFYSVSQCALDCVYLRRIMELLGYEQTSPTLIAQDNNACIFLVKGSGMYARAKHIDTRVHRVREFASGDKPEVKLYKIAGEYQPADIFTKGLPRVAFQRHRRTIMGE